MSAASGLQDTLRLVTSSRQAGEAGSTERFVLGTGSARKTGQWRTMWECAHCLLPAPKLDNTGACLQVASTSRAPVPARPAGTSGTFCNVAGFATMSNPYSSPPSCATACCMYTSASGLCFRLCLSLCDGASQFMCGANTAKNIEQVSERTHLQTMCPDRHPSCTTRRTYVVQVPQQQQLVCRSLFSQWRCSCAGAETLRVASYMVMGALPLMMCDPAACMPPQCAQAGVTLIRRSSNGPRAAVDQWMHVNVVGRKICSDAAGMQHSSVG